MHRNLITTSTAIHQLPANTPLCEEVQNALYAAIRHHSAMSAGIEALAVRAFEQGEVHLLDDIANLSSQLTEHLRSLSTTIINLKPHG